MNCDAIGPTAKSSVDHNIPYICMYMEKKNKILE